MNNPRRIQRHLVRAAAAGALLAAAALPLAIATSAGAVPPVPTVTSVTFTPHGATASTIAEGATGTVAITGTNFVDNGGTVTITDSGSGVVWGSVVETSTTTATATYDATTATPNTLLNPSYSLTLTDLDGPGTLNSAFMVTAPPTLTAIAPSPIYEGTGANTVTLTGSGFETGATCVLRGQPWLICSWHGSYGLGDLDQRGRNHDRFERHSHEPGQLGRGVARYVRCDGCEPRRRFGHGTCVLHGDQRYSGSQPLGCSRISWRVQLQRSPEWFRI